MAFGDFDLTSSKARFEALSDLDKAGQWVAFIDALDAGGAGFHPHYPHLASLYEQGETPFQNEALEPRPGSARRARLRPLQRGVRDASVLTGGSSPPLCARADFVAAPVPRADSRGALASPFPLAERSIGSMALEACRRRA